MTAAALLFIAELIGVAAFAISGVLVAIDYRLDLFGALILGAVTSVGGGMTRDILIGQTPPVMFTNPIYALTAVCVSLTVFVLFYFFGNRISFTSPITRQIINFSDAIGLGVFVTTGVDAILRSPLSDNAFLAIFIGTVTGVGGGLLRDIFVATIPAIFRKHIYAIAAILGASGYYFMRQSNIPVGAALPITVGAVIIIRLLATHYRWNLPRIPEKDRTPPN